MAVISATLHLNENGTSRARTTADPFQKKRANVLHLNLTSLSYQSRGRAFREYILEAKIADNYYVIYKTEEPGLGWIGLVFRYLQKLLSTFKSSPDEDQKNAEAHMSKSHTLRCPKAPQQISEKVILV